jgi:proteasome accessory factor B
MTAERHLTRGAPDYTLTDHSHVTTRTRSLAAAKLQRWIDLLAELLRRSTPATFEDLAREVPAYDTRGKQKASVLRMFERDKDELRAFGIPIETVELEEGESYGYRLRREDFYMPYLLLASSAGTRAPSKVDRYGYRALKSLAFEPDELAAVAEAAARVRQLADPLLHADVDSAMRKLAFDQVVDAVAEPDTTLVPQPHAAASRATLELLGNALLRRKRVAFDYHSMGMDTTTRRSVEPYGLFFVSAHWYLAGRDREKDSIRNFRVSRIENPVINPSRAQSADYGIPESFDLLEHARSRHAWELGDGEAEDAVVEFTASDGAVAAASRLGEPVEGHPSRRRFRVRRLDTFARWLLSFGGDVWPVSPPGLVSRYRELARGVAFLYESSS